MDERHTNVNGSKFAGTMTVRPESAVWSRTEPAPDWFPNRTWEEAAGVRFGRRRPPFLRQEHPPVFLVSPQHL